MADPDSNTPGAASCAGTACGACNGTAPPAPTAAPPAGHTYRIATMDCPVEEAEIRRALAPVAGIHALSFQLAARRLTLQAPDAVREQALQAIRQAGFTPEAVGDPAVPGAAHGHDHAAAQGAGYETEQID